LARRSLGLARTAEDQVDLGDDDHDPLAEGELDTVAHPLQEEDADGQEDEPAEGDGGELGDMERRAVDDEEDAEGDPIPATSIVESRRSIHSLAK